MIQLTRINESPFFINCDLIEFIDATPDTVLTLTTGEKVRVREAAGEVVRKVMSYKGELMRRGAPPGGFIEGGLEG